MNNEQDVVFTIGHSTHPIETFVELLRAHGVTAVADVRSSPYSRFNPQFNREALDRGLRSFGIKYVFLGRELGARTEDRSCYDNGRVNYRRLAQTALFRSGLDRVRAGARTERIALMCSEKEPLDCHRTILVSRELEALGLDIQHIHSDGHLESHQDGLTRLRRTFDLVTADFFQSEEELVDRAYSKQEERIAYVDRDSSEEEQKL